MTPEQTLAQWDAEIKGVQERARGKGAVPGVIPPEAVGAKTGLEVMQAILAGELPFAYIAQTLDYLLVVVERGRAVFQGTPQLRHYNPLGTVHGGWYSTLLDSALGCAVHTMMPAGRAYTTAEFSLNIVRAATERTGPLRATGTVIHCGNRLATAEGRIEGPDGRLYAHATTTCFVFETQASVS